MSRIVRRPPSVWPPITDGLTFYAPMTRDFGTVPVYSAAGSTGLSVETVDADGTYIEDFSNIIVGADANTARVGVDGVLSEVATTNRALQGRDFSVGAVWDPTDMAIDATANAMKDGTSRTTNELRATAGNATLIQDLGVIGSAAGAFSLWIKRKTGSGAIQLTRDGGAGWTAVTVTSEWTRVSKVQTVENPDIGIRIVTSGDEVLVDFAQDEAQAASTSAIITAAAAVARAADDLAFASSGNVSKTSGTIMIAVTPFQDASDYASNGCVIDIGSGTDRLLLFHNTATNKWAYQVKSGSSVFAAIESSTGPVKDATVVLAIIWATNDARLYTNGADEQDDTTVTVPASLPASIDIAQFYNAVGQIGSKQHLLIWDRALSASDVLEMYNAHYVKRGIC